MILLKSAESSKWQNLSSLFNVQYMRGSKITVKWQNLGSLYCTVHAGIENNHKVAELGLSLLYGTCGDQKSLKSARTWTLFTVRYMRGSKITVKWQNLSSLLTVRYIRGWKITAKRQNLGSL